MEVAMLDSDAAMDCEEAMTVFHDVSGFGRRNRAADRMTEKHAEMALSGWRFADMQIYTENGDLTLGMRLSGVNPEVDPTQPVILNLNVENNIPQLLKSLQAIRTIEEVLERETKE